VLLVYVHAVGLPMDRPPEVGNWCTSRNLLLFIYRTFLDAWWKITGWKAIIM